MKIPRKLSENLKRFQVVRDAVDTYHLTRRRLAGTYDRTRLFVHLNLQTNNICNRDCYFCEYGVPGRKQKNEFMSEELIDKVVAELQALDYRDRLSLFEINEPLTDKRLLKLLGKVTSALPNAWHTLTSNGDLLNPTKVQTLFEAGLDQLWLSSYDDKGRSHNLALMASAPPLVQPRIVHVDMVAVAETEMNLDNRAGLIQLKRRGAKKGNGRPCERVERQMIIKPSGKVMSCSSDFYGANVMGDANTQTLAEIWFGEKFEALRAELRSGNRGASDLCSKCDYAGYGGFQENMPPKRPDRLLPPPATSASTAVAQS